MEKNKYPNFNFKNSRGKTEVEGNIIEEISENVMTNVLNEENARDPYAEYEKECIMHNSCPIGALRDVLKGDNEELNLENYRLDSMNLYLLCQIIIGPPIYPLTYLNLKNTVFDEKACSAISELLEMNPHLKKLILENCKIGSKGAEILANGIHLSDGLLHLNLSNCNMGDVGGAAICKALAKSDSCKYVDLSKNQLHIQTAVEFNNTLRKNTSLEVVNLRWNDFYPEDEASVKIAEGLQVNTLLRELDLSWNGISGNHFSKTLSKVFRENNSLRIINLENNLLQSENIKHIAFGLNESKAIEEIYFGNNFLQQEDYLSLIESAETSRSLKILSLGHFTWLEDEAYHLCKDLMKKKPFVKVIFKDKLYPNPPRPIDFRAIIIDRCKYLSMAHKIKKFRRNFGHFMYNLLAQEKEFINEDEFYGLVKESKIRLDANLMKHLADEFSYKSDEVNKKKSETMMKVNIRQMADYYLKKYPTEAPPPRKMKKIRKRKSRPVKDARKKRI